MQDKTDRHWELCKQLHETYKAKNADYGDSFSKSFARYGALAAIVRMGDKLNRLETLAGAERHVRDERVADTLMDLANYALMTRLELEGDGIG